MTAVLFTPKVGRLSTGYTLYTCTKVKHDKNDKTFSMTNNTPVTQEACETDTPSTKSYITDFGQIYVSLESISFLFSFQIKSAFFILLHVVSEKQGWLNQHQLCYFSVPFK